MTAPLGAHAFDEVAAALDDGVRYERGGVMQRAQASFEEVTQRWQQNPPAAAEAWWRLANIHRLASRWDEALEAARVGAALAQEYALPDVEADALNIEGAVWATRGDYARARTLFQRMIELSGTPSTRAKALQNLGGMAAEEQSFEEAEQLFLASREEYRLASDTRGEAVSLINLGRLQLERGDPTSAFQTMTAAVNASRQTSDLELHASALLNLGIVLSALGLHAAAEERITTAYGQFTIADIPVQRVRCLMQLATVAMRRGDPASARVCLLHARDVAAASQLTRELAVMVEQLAAIEAALAPS